MIWLEKKKKRQLTDNEDCVFNYPNYVKLWNLLARSFLLNINFQESCIIEFYQSSSVIIDKLQFYR